MAKSRRASIADLVGSFESAIQENRKKGYDKDLTGKVVDHKPVYTPDRVKRLSMLFPPQEKNTAPVTSNSELFNTDGTLRVKLRKLAANARQRVAERRAKLEWCDEDGCPLVIKNKRSSLMNEIDESVTGTTEEETITTEEAYDLLHDDSFRKRVATHNRRVQFGQCGRVPSVIETHSDDANEASADVSEAAAEALAEDVVVVDQQTPVEEEPARDALRASLSVLMESAEPLATQAMQVEKEKKKRRSLRRKAKERVLAEEAKQPPAAPRPASPPPTSILSEEEQAEDPEIQALLERIQRLQGDYEAVKDREAEDMKKLERSKKMQMARFWEKRKSKRHIMYDSLNLGEEAMEQREKQFAKVQAEIQQLRDENKVLRKRCVDYTNAMVQLRKENSELELDQSTTERYIDELESIQETQEVKHRRASAILPAYESKVDLCLEEVDNRDAWTEMERRILGHYKAFELKMIEMVEYRCEDSDLVEEVVRLHLGLDPIPE